MKPPNKFIMLSFWTALVLLSSCHTRKGLDAFFEIPFQKTLNASKAKVQQEVCAELEWNQITEYNTSTIDSSHFDDDTSFSCFANFESLKCFTFHQSFSISKESHSHHPKLPLYLLYQHFKVDLV